MPNRKKKKTKKKKKARADEAPKDLIHTEEDQCSSYNYLGEASRGCHVAHLSTREVECGIIDAHQNWIIGAEFFNPSCFGDESPQLAELPDLSIDPESGLLTLINQSGMYAKSFSVSLSHKIYGRDEHVPLAMHRTTDGDGEDRHVVTLLITMPPQSLVDVCYIEAKHNQNDAIDLYSNISEISPHQSQSCVFSLPSVPFPLPQALSSPAPSTSFSSSAGTKSSPASFGFPLEGSGPFMCTQGCGGRFTHFLPATFHAIDLRCPIGTPVIAVADGTICQINQTETVSGIHASNLFRWNSILMRLDTPQVSDNYHAVFVEYVHINAHSCCVNIGDKVRKGQRICASGAAGFCPEPHLHICAYASDAKDAPTISFNFIKSNSIASESNSIEALDDAQESPTLLFLPRAGEYCDSRGIVPNTVARSSLIMLNQILSGLLERVSESHQNPLEAFPQNYNNGNGVQITLQDQMWWICSIIADYSR